MAEKKRNTGKHVGQAIPNTIGSLGALLSSAMEQKKKTQEKPAIKTESCPCDCKEKFLSRTDQEKIASDIAKQTPLDQDYELSKIDSPSKELKKEVSPTREVVVVHKKQDSVTVRSVTVSDKYLHRPSAISQAKKKTKVKKLNLKKTEESVPRLNIEKKVDSRPPHPVKDRPKEPLFGCQTQACLTSTPNKESDIIIGIDLGTSSTKVVVRDAMLNQAYAIPFAGFAPKENCYLLPTTISINSQNGALSFNDGTVHESELKIKFIEKIQNYIIFEDKTQGVACTIQEAVVGYLALAFREIRGWFFTETQQQYADTDIKWNINIGIPSENYDNKRLRERFQLVAQVAWYASAQNRDIDLDLIKQAVLEIEQTNTRIASGDNSVLDDAHLHPGYFSTHPEVIMEVLGYVKSPMGGQGTHLLIDIGASTLDVAMFRVGEKDGEDIYPMLSSKVAQLGSIILHRTRIESIRSALESKLFEIAHISPIAPLPDSKSYQIGCCQADTCKSDTDFSSACYKAIGEVVRKTMLYRDGFSEVWSNQLPVFICGGGGREQLYSNVVREMSTRYNKSKVGFRGFKLLSIPKPLTLQAPDIAPDDYNRLAVAYGLSFSNFEIGSIIPESGVEGNRRVDRFANHDEKYIGAEQV